mgnify:CR=1 FL=1
MKALLNKYDPLNDYRLILDMPAVIKQKITEVKNEFDEDYKGVIIPGGQPFVYLATFAGHESTEEDIIDALNKVALGFMPFKMHLKDFDHINNSEIFIGIEEQVPLQKLIQQVEQTISGTEDLLLNGLPRITIAKRLQPFQFVKSWEKYKEKNFSATLVANEMLLIKRMEGFRSWQILRRLAFQNLVISW